MARRNVVVCMWLRPSEFKNNHRFSIENHHFSGATPHHFCICNRKFNKKILNKLAFVLQFAVRPWHGREAGGNSVTHPLCKN